MGNAPIGAPARQEPTPETEKPRQPSDQALLEAYVARRDQAAFAALVERYGKTVWGVCRRVLHQEQDTEDAFQAVFVVLARKAASIRKGEAVGSWLYGVAYRTAMKARRSAARRENHERRARELARPVDDAEPWGEAACREVQRALDEEVQRLGAKYRAPFVLCNLERMSKAEAAQELGWKEGTISGRLARARKMLQARLARRGIALSAALTAVELVEKTAEAAPAGLLHVTATWAPLAGKPAGSAISPTAVRLAETVIRSMRSARGKVGLALFLGLLLLLGGVAVVRMQVGSDMIEPDLFVPPPVALGTPIDGQVLSVAFTPDGTKLFTAGGSAIRPGQIQTWNVAGKKNLRTWRPLPGVRSLSFAGDGRIFATGDFRGDLKLRDAATGEERASVSAHATGVTSVTFAPDGKSLLSAGLDRTLKLWQVNGLTEQKTFPGHGDAVLAAAFFHEKAAIVSGGEDKIVIIWDANAGKPKLTLAGHRSAVEAVAVSADDKLVASACRDGTVKLWNAETGEEKALLDHGPTAVNAVAFSRNDKLLACARADGTVRLWDVQTQQVVGELGKHKAAVRAIAFSPDSTLLASGSSDRTARLWHVSFGRKLAELAALSPLTRPIQAVAYSPDGRAIAMATTDPEVQIRDAVSGDVLRVLKGHAGTVNALAFSPDGQALASGSSDQTVRLWDWETGQGMLTVNHGSEVYALTFTRAGKSVVAAGSDGVPRLWDIESGKESKTFPGHAGAVHALALAPDGRTLVTGGADEAIRICDLTGAKEPATLTGHKGAVRALVFAADGVLASAGADRLIKLWEPTLDRERLTLTGHEGEIAALAFTPGGRTLVSAGLDKAIRVWDSATGELRTILHAHKNTVTTLTIHPRGKDLVSGSLDTMALRWRGQVKSVTAAQIKPPSPKKDPKPVAPDPAPRQIDKARAALDQLIRALEDRRTAKVRTEYPREYFQSFKGNPGLRREFKWFGPDAERCLTFEPEGLRLSLPAGHPKRPGTGLVVAVPARGDFEITVSFTILHEPGPVEAGEAQTRLTLAAVLARPEPGIDQATLSRHIYGGRTEFLGWLQQWDKSAGKNRVKLRAIPTKARSGRLRLVRAGSVLSYLVSDNASPQFTPLVEYAIGTRDLLAVRLVGTTGSAEASLDVRFTDLRIRAEAFAEQDVIPVAHRKLRTDYPQEYSQSFKGNPGLRKEFRWYGRDAERRLSFEPDGLRLTLPAGQPTQSTGLAIAVPVKGDFEITVSFAILHEPEPAEAGQEQVTRLTLEAVLNKPGGSQGNDMASLSRRIYAGGGRQFFTWQRQWDEVAEKSRKKVKAIPTKAKSGKLRLVRSGTLLSYLVSEDSKPEFTTVIEYAHGSEDLSAVRLVGATGSAEASIDVRFTDLRIRAEAVGDQGDQDVVPAAAAKLRTEYRQEYFQSFKNNPGDRPEFRWFGPEAEECVRFEPEGMRLTLPAGHPKRPGTGLEIALPVKGDFEITVNFDIVHEPEPADAGQQQATRLTLDANLNKPGPQGNDAATFSRRVFAGGGRQFFPWLRQWDEQAGQYRMKSWGVATKAKSGKLRLVRKGSKLTYLASENSSPEFTALASYEFGSEDLKLVRLTGSTGGENASLDVHFSDLRIRADSIPDLGITAAGADEGIWSLLIVAGLLTAGLTLGAWLCMRRRGKSPRPVLASVSFSCSACGKQLRARAELAGKHVKCPACTRPVAIPAANAIS